MIHGAICKDRYFFAAGAKRALRLLASVGLTVGIFSARAADSEMAPKLDFTKLSLEELLKADITPINVLGSHTHLSKEIMFGYRYSFEKYDGNLDGTREVSAAEVLSKYPVHHTFMDTQMHMMELMYAPSDRWTVMVMGQYMRMDMGHLRANGTTFTAGTEGFGDTELMALYTILGDPRKDMHHLVLNGGISLPTGSIDQSEDGAPLEYPMQLGSGTFDLLPGITYLGMSESFSWGAQAAGTLHMGRNDRGYTLGDMYRLGAWGYYKITEWAGTSIRMEWRDWQNISGADAALNPARNPAFDATKQEGRRLNILGGLHFYAHEGALKGLRFSVEGGVPVYQNLSGPNLKQAWTVTTGISYVIR